MLQKSIVTLFATTGLMLTPLAPAAIAQRISNFEPAANATNVAPNAVISGQFDTTTGVAVDLNTVKVFVNGKDVTNQSSITGNFFTYRPSTPLPAGQTQVRVEFKNVNGNARASNWTFTVQAAQPPAQLSSVTHDGAGVTLNTGQTLTMTMNGTAGAQGAFLLVQDNRTVREIPARESSSGVYTASLTLQSNDRVTEGVVLGRLRRGNQNTYAAATQPVALNARNAGNPVGGNTDPGRGNPSEPTTPSTQLQPRFTSHKDNDRVSRDGFTLTGQTRPNAKVQIKIVAGASVLGVIVGGQTIVDQQVTADNTGRFQIDVPDVVVGLPGLRYRIQATATEGNQTSQPTQLTLRGPATN